MLAVAGGKGGSGKTTTALGLAAAIVRKGGQSIVVDADRTMPNLHVLAGVSPTPTTDELAAGHDHNRVRQEWPAVPGVAIVAAGHREPLDAALSRIDCWEGTVLIDCPAGAGHDAARPLRSADRTVLVTTDANEALEDTVKTDALARELDASPVGAVVRGETRCAEQYLPDMPVLGVPEFPAGAVLTRPAFREACDSLADAMVASKTQSSLDENGSNPPDDPSEPVRYPER